MCTNKRYEWWYALIGPESVCCLFYGGLVCIGVVISIVFLLCICSDVEGNVYCCPAISRNFVICAWLTLCVGKSDIWCVLVWDRSMHMVCGSMGHGYVDEWNHCRSEGIPMWSSPLWSSGLDPTDSENLLYGPIPSGLGWLDLGSCDHGLERRTGLLALYLWVVLTGDQGVCISGTPSLFMWHGAMSLGTSVITWDSPMSLGIALP